MEKLNHTPSLYVFAHTGCDEQTASEIRNETAAAAGRSEYRRDVCLGRERLSNSTLKGKAKSYSAGYHTKRNEAYKLLVSAATKRGCILVDCVAADRCNHWGIVQLQAAH